MFILPVHDQLPKFKISYFKHFPKDYPFINQREKSIFMAEMKTFSKIGNKNFYILYKFLTL